MPQPHIQLNYHTQTHDVTPSECAVWNETARERETDRQRGNEVTTIKLKEQNNNEKVEAAQLHTHRYPYKHMVQSLLLMLCYGEITDTCLCLRGQVWILSQRFYSFLFFASVLCVCVSARSRAKNTEHFLCAYLWHSAYIYNSNAKYFTCNRIYIYILTNSERWAHRHSHHCQNTAERSVSSVPMA